MFSPKHLRLMLAASLVISLLGFLTVTLHAGKHAAEAEPSTMTLKSKLLRKKTRSNEKLTEAEVAWLRKHAVQQEERQVEDSIPKHVPIKVKLKREKEAKFKDLNNSDWLRDFELEVTNTSNKPIYFL